MLSSEGSWHPAAASLLWPLLASNRPPADYAAQRAALKITHAHPDLTFFIPFGPRSGFGSAVDDLDLSVTGGRGDRAERSQIRRHLPRRPPTANRCRLFLRGSSARTNAWFCAAQYA